MKRRSGVFLAILATTAFLATASLALAAPADDTVYGLKRTENMVLGMVGDPRTINPFLANDRWNTSQTYHHVHDVLLNRSPAGKVSPRMAQHWTRLDEMTW